MVATRPTPPVTLPPLCYLLVFTYVQVWRSTSTVLVQGKHKFWSAETSPKPPMSYLEVARTEGYVQEHLKEGAQAAWARP